ncbi:MAG TPA: hypothetical protein DDX85_09320 [Nitrospiraceae bacterium]|nr:hypothetical protein [Nitrospiraceae bacterium]
MIYDKRKLKRYDIFFIVEFKPLSSRSGFSIGITRDLSPEGFSLESQTVECQCGDIMEFRLKHPDAEWAVDISGEVIWKNHSWYKYVIGIKFLRVNEEQNAKILKLMSSVRDEAYIPDLNSNNSESIQGGEGEKHPDALPNTGAIDTPRRDTRVTQVPPVSLRGVEHCEVTGAERTFISREGLGIRIADSPEEIKPARDEADSDKHFGAPPIKNNGANSEPVQVTVDDIAAEGTTRPDIMQESDVEHEKIYAAHVNHAKRRSRQDTVQAPNFKIMKPAKNNRKKKLWLYIPSAMVLIIIFAIALPVMINKFNHASIDFNPLLTESTDSNDIGKDTEIPASDSVQMSSQALHEPSSELSPFQQTETAKAIPLEKENPLHVEQASVREDATGILPPTSIVITEVKSKKSDDTAPPAKMEHTIKHTPEMNKATILKPETRSIDKPLRDNVEKNKKIDLIAKIDETLKDLRAIENEKPKGADIVIQTQKTPEVKPLVKTEEHPVPSQIARLEETSAEAALTKSVRMPEVEPLVKTEEHPVPSQVVKLEETPAKAIKESVKMPVLTQEVQAAEEKKDDIKKADTSVKSPELPNVVLLVKRDTPRTSLNNSPAAPRLTTADLLNKWKHIGSTKSGVPLFIAPDNTSYPYEHIVNLLVKASVNKKDFIDSLAINCAQVKLRILEERNGNNPVLSSYSHEWKDIVPDSMILYNSACPEKK